MLNVVIDLDDSCSSNWWYPEVKSILLNILSPLKSVVSSSTVGVWCHSRNMALFNSLMSTASVSFLGTGTVGETHGVGSPVTFSIIS